ncbi:hypothetical protein Pcinc_017135 [Petrolisthes cinctipes]|uniref:Uncharacterized protein n=1 Tax=Petrolisthes cinctipes TaxID=88211 RepID=A0AAE1FPP8_PETCI|nr:hypothetical protein Pcinc_017135 [Petrolisthes cinctipes]
MWLGTGWISLASTRRSRPPPTLSYTLNTRSAPAGWLEPQVNHEDEEGLITSTLRLRFSLQRQLLQEGDVQVACVAEIPNVYREEARDILSTTPPYHASVLGAAPGGQHRSTSLAHGTPSPASPGPPTPLRAPPSTPTPPQVTCLQSSSRSSISSHHPPPPPPASAFSHPSPGRLQSPARLLSPVVTLLQSSCSLKSPMHPPVFTRLASTTLHLSSSSQLRG